MMAMAETVLINTVIPAEPGWKLAGFAERDDNHGAACFWYSDVVAWQIKVIRDGEIRGEEFHFVKPIVVDGTNVTTMSEQWALRRPDGVYLWYGEQELGTEAQAIERLQKHIDDMRAREPKTALSILRD
jgi:hypothetical protein